MFITKIKIIALHIVYLNLFRCKWLYKWQPFVFTLMLDEILLIPFSVILFQRKKNKCKTLNMLNIDFNFYLILFMNIFNYRWNRIFSKFFWKHKYRCWTAFSGLLFWIVCLCRLVSVQFLLVKDIRINKYDDDCGCRLYFFFWMLSDCSSHYAI